MTIKKAMFGAGCFWGVEEAFRTTKGVVETEVGFSGGTVKDPSYKRVCFGFTGHAEVVLVKYDDKKTTYKKLLEVFWKIHDPTQKNRQGWDVGKQYRTAIFYFDEKQKKEAQNSLKKEQKKYDKEIQTEITKAKPFYKAEEYHQKYLLKRGKNVC